MGGNNRLNLTRRAFTRLLMGGTLGAGLVGCFRSDPGAVGNRQLFRAPKTTSMRMNDVTLTTLQNGLQLVHRPSNASAIVGISLAIPMGAANDEGSKAGRTNLLMRLLTKGTKTRSAEQIATELADLGITLVTKPGYDTSYVAMKCLEQDVEKGFEILADVLTNPVFPVRELDLEREKVLAGIRMSNDTPAGQASRELQARLFPGHPYGVPLEGVPETLAQITATDLGNAHRDNFVPSNMVLASVGRLSADTVRQLAEKHLGAVTVERRPRYVVDKTIAPGGTTTFFEKDSQQGYVLIGALTCAQGDKDEAPLTVAATILGGGMSSRLFAELRDRQGLAYAVGAGTSFLRTKGLFTVYIGTSPETIERWFPREPATDVNPALRNDLWLQVDLLRREPVTQEELARARNAIAGDLLRGRERNLTQSTQLAWQQLTGVGPDYEDRFLEAIRSVTERDIMRVANRYFLDPTVVVVRPRAQRTN